MKKIIFIGNFQLGPGGERSDEGHIVRELVAAGNEVTPIPRDEWREYVLEGQLTGKYKVPEDKTADIVIFAKWHHFFDGRFIDAARRKFQAPVFYWVWDYMADPEAPEWHLSMAGEADLFLSGELGRATYYHQRGIPFYYFQFDSCDGEFPPMHSPHKLYDVVYLGSCTNQNGRLDLLKKINEVVKIQVFAYDFEEWRKHGFQAAPPAYGFEFNKIVAQSKIVLGTSGGPDCFGYWSNRVGKVLHAAGFLLQLYAPGMELFLGDGCEYFSSAEEAVEKIRFYLENPDKREAVIERNIIMNRDRWTSEYKVRQLLVLIDRYLKDGSAERWLLP